MSTNQIKRYLMNPQFKYSRFAMFVFIVIIELITNGTGSQLKPCSLQYLPVSFCNQFSYRCMYPQFANICNLLLTHLKNKFY